MEMRFRLFCSTNHEEDTSTDRTFLLPDFMSLSVPLHEKDLRTTARDKGWERKEAAASKQQPGISEISTTVFGVCCKTVAFTR